MEDVIRLYEKIKSQDGNAQEIEKKIQQISEKLSKVKVFSDKRPISPQNISDYGEFSTALTPRKGVAGLKSLNMEK